MGKTRYARAAMYSRMIVGLALILGAVCAAGWAYYYGPYYYDDFKMQTCVGDAVLTWASLGMEKGKDQLRQSMNERSIGDYLDRDKYCRFYEESDEKNVECEWEVIVEVPLLGRRRVSFDRIASATRDGRLAD